jgi:predicted  nucleic acid-binding Zn ribbon protein
MYLAQITFGVPRQALPPDQLEDLILSYLIFLHKNGQITNDYLYTLSAGSYLAYANLVRPDALRQQYHSKYALTELERLQVTFGKNPDWQILTDQPSSEFHDFQTSTFLYLAPTPDTISPVGCGDTGQRLPLYLIDIDIEQRDRLFLWTREYNRTDGLFMYSGELEIPAYRQLASPHSGLATEGRNYAGRIEAATGIPTYYYLTRYYGRGDAERDRTCPSCNGEWLLQENLSPPKTFWRFPFRCPHCRLVSHIADAAYDDEFATIGEFVLTETT